MAIPSDRNTSVKVAEKLSKYKHLEIEITKMWGLKTITVPVVIGALGVVKKGIEKHIDKIPGKINITELQIHKFYRSIEVHDYPLEPQTLDWIRH